MSDVQLNTNHDLDVALLNATQCHECAITNPSVLKHSTLCPPRMAFCLLIHLQGPNISCPILADPLYGCCFCFPPFCLLL